MQHSSNYAPVPTFLKHKTDIKYKMSKYLQIKHFYFQLNVLYVLHDLQSYRARNCPREYVIISN